MIRNSIASIRESNFGRRKMNRRYFLAAALGTSALWAADRNVRIVAFGRNGQRQTTEALPMIMKTDAEWRKQLSPTQYDVTRKKGTERAFSGEYNAHKGDGLYRCVCCETALFDSRHKFDSGTGWPSFFQPVAKENVAEHVDKALFMTRTEILCARCDAHLGHVFDDGPRPTGLRYCMNSASLRFVARTSEK